MGLSGGVGLSSHGSGDALVRFPSRPVLAASVCAALAASGGTVLTMPDQPAGVPDITQDPAAGTGLAAPQPVDVASTVAGPPVSGAQIAGLALAPARERASTLVSQRAAAHAAEAKAAQKEQAREKAEQQQQEKEQEAQQRSRRAGSSDWEEFRSQLREACNDGRIRGQICRGA
jgi:hypothetical protein